MKQKLKDVIKDSAIKFKITIAIYEEYSCTYKQWTSTYIYDILGYPNYIFNDEKTLKVFAIAVSNLDKIPTKDKCNELYETFKT